MFSASKAGPRARDMVWQFTKDKWSELKQRYKGQFLLSRIIDVSQNIMVVKAVSCNNQLGLNMHTAMAETSKDLVSYKPHTHRTSL